MIFKHRNHSWSLVVTRGHSWSLVVTRGHSWSLVVTRGHSWSLVVTRGHSWSLVVTRGHSWSLVVTRGHSWCCLQLSCKLNLDRTVYTVFQNIRYSSKKFKCFKCCFLKTEHFMLSDMHSALAVDIYRAQWKHINYSM